MKIKKLIEWLRNNNREDNCHDCGLGYYLEPEEMLSGIDVAKIACALHELNAYKDLGPIDHLRELAKADREGRVLILPFKPPKTVWMCSKKFPEPGQAHYASAINVLCDMDRGCVFGDTPEAAEEALKARKGGKHETSD